MNLENRVALITGAGRGIGKAVAICLAKAGADIIFTNRNKNFSDQTQSAIEAIGRRCLAFQVDVADLEAVEEMVRAAQDSFPRIDILVNNAGITRDTLFLQPDGHVQCYENCHSQYDSSALWPYSQYQFSSRIHWKSRAGELQCR